jgi:hypothetical protein
VLARHRVHARQARGGAGLLPVYGERHRRIVGGPHRLYRIGNVADRGAVQGLLDRGALGAAHDRQKRAAPVRALDQREVGVQFAVRHRRAVADALQPHQEPEHRRVERFHPQFPDAAVTERFHGPRRPEVGHVHGGVEQGERGDAGRRGGGELEADRAPDVVYDQVELAEAEFFHRGQAELPEPGPAVVVAAGPLGQAEARQVERNAAQAARGQFGQHLAIQE